MKKTIILIFLILTTLSYSQKLTDNSKGYTEVIHTELKQDAIYQKLMEWISINYKSAQNVIQLDTKDKVITKGNTVLNYSSMNTIVKYSLSFTTVFSIQDNKYKVDLTPTDIGSVNFPDIYTPLSMYEMLMTNELLSLENYTIITRKQSLNYFLSMGYSEKKSSKMIQKSNKYLVGYYDSYKLNKVAFDKEINNTYTSIKNAVNKKDDW